MKLKKHLLLFFALLLSWMLIHCVVITIDGRTDKGNAADVAVILGNKVNEDGSLSERLKQRLLCGLQLFKAGRVKQLIVSGGLGREGFYEGDKMRDFLVQNGVPASAIITDNKGNTTELTVKNTIALQPQLHFTSLIVVSQYFHVTRTKMLFRKYGFANVSSVSPAYYEWRDFYSLFREFGAYYTSLF